MKTINETGVVDVRRAADRFATDIDWLASRHSFSFGHHYDPANRNHGLLVVSNDDIVKPGTGFNRHPHENMEIVTWVLSGELEHEDSAGHHGIIYPGLAQRMSAGSGIWHSEKNPSPDKDVHLVQMWVLPDALNVKPSYAQADVSGELEKGGLVPIASGGKPAAAVFIHQRDAVLWAGRLKPGGKVTLPDALFVHLYVAKGTLALEKAGSLETGDAARLTRAGALDLTAGNRGAEVLVWEMNKDAQ